ncbi:hypothetical protein A1O1_06756 [Capronia coronata CBS 617.96]|uniref:Uncharacterized protein n=1 Tax=Capronia coronata CBS 617.96 TaxID=1182541 RepID=W9XRE7_9EURO|nr:uncharacterized protein A1O1_06756 [Capronia coronata CBS 617.96]EXJ83137.1 hypothetical protein A1O1_06756 [Capronia coronata CBS 617.96]
MTTLPIRPKRQSHDPVHEIIQAHREHAAGTKPAWYYLARLRMPELSREAVDLLQEQYRLEVDSECKTTTAQKWAQIGRQLRDKIPSHFDTLDHLQKRIDMWTVCDREAIARLFEGAVTETERLKVLLGSSMDAPSPGDAFLQRKLAHDNEAVKANVTNAATEQKHALDDPDDDDHESDTSVEIRVEGLPSKKARRNRRQREKRRNRAAGAAAGSSGLTES